MAKSTLLCLFLCLVPYNVVSAADFHSCSAVRSEYNRQGFYDDVPEQPFPGTELKFCKGSERDPPLTCCTKVMEHKLSVQSRIDFDAKLKKLLNPLAKLFERSLYNYKDMFRDMLNHSQSSFDEMFRKTYGILYQQNSAIFTDLFDSLEAYFENGQPEMQSQMDDFFRKLNGKLFTVYNSQYEFSKHYLKCVNQHMEELKPFGDIPAKLTVNMKRSFVAFRTFVQGISTAASVVKNVVKINPNINCLHELMKMTHCSTCAGHLGVKPCLNYCLDVQTMCLSHHQPLVEEWKQFVDAMEKVGSRLEGPFSIAKEIEPISFKISGAIMNFQESGVEISKKVFHGCGEPRLGRYRHTRETHGELELKSLKFDHSRNGNGDSGRAKSAQFERMVREMKTKIKNSRGFWDDLPSEMCKEARHHGAAKCWNGQALGIYNGSLENPFKGTFVSKMDEEIFKLKVITNKLLEAHAGRDVSWIDDEWLSLNNSKRRHLQDESYEGSGSYNVPKSQYPPDDEDGYVTEGSGSDEGSGFEPIHEDTVNSVYEEVTPKPVPPVKENPSSAPSEKPMSLTWAIAVYFLPAVFTFLGTIG